jgi:hypothetical protein
VPLTLYAFRDRAGQSLDYALTPSHAISIPLEGVITFESIIEKQRPGEQVSHHGLPDATDEEETCRNPPCVGARQFFGSLSIRVIGVIRGSLFSNIPDGSVRSLFRFR